MIFIELYCKIRKYWWRHIESVIMSDNFWVIYCDVIWCNRPPVRDVCPNHEMVLFQPHTVTPPYLGSVAYRYTFKLGLPPHLFLLPFHGLFVFPSFLPPPHPYSFIAEALFFFNYSPPSLLLQIAAHIYLSYFFTSKNPPLYIHPM